MLLTLLLLLPSSALSSPHHPDLVYSNASLSLTLSSSSRTLAGAAASSHSLEFLLANRGSPRHFLVRQEGREGLVGRLQTRQLFLMGGQFATLRVDGLRLPQTGQSLYTLVVEELMENIKLRPDPGSPDYGLPSGGLEDWEEEAPGWRAAVECSVLLRRVEEGAALERAPPLLQVWVEEDTCSEEEQCSGQSWMLGFSTRDHGSGLFAVRLRSVEDSLRHFWWHDRFSAGDRGDVSGGAWVSCCSPEVELEAEDVGGEVQVVRLDREGAGLWGVLVPLIAGVVSTLAVAAVLISVCYCRRRYKILTQTDV